MKLIKLYQEIIKKGIETDARSKQEIQRVLAEKKKAFDALPKQKKEFCDSESFTNPFADTRILNGNPQDAVTSAIVGIDVGGQELLLVDRLKQNGLPIDLVISHHPQGKAYANFYEVMDVQADIFHQQGISLGGAESMLFARKAEVARRLSAANHQRSVDIARWLKINFLCMHTPTDNCAYSFIAKLIKKQKPTTLGKIVDLLLTLPEYKDAARNNNPPRIINGNKSSRVSKVHIEFTGGTEGPSTIYEKLSDQGVDTIIAMHQSEEHFKKSKQANINVIIASHIASDALGINVMLDHLEGISRLKIYEFSGFRRTKRKKT